MNAYIWSRIVLLSNSKLLLFILLILLPVLVLIDYPSSASSQDYDIWWHMALGRYYVTNFTMTINHAIFSWVPADAGWIYNTWLGSTILYLAYNVLSGFGLWLIQWVIFVLLFLMYFFQLRSTHAKLDTVSVTCLLLLAVGLSLLFVYYKPEMFSVLLFTLVLFLYFQAKTTGKNFFWLYPLIFIFWVNLHGGFVFGLFALSVLLFFETIEFFFIKKDPLTGNQLLSFAITLPLSYAACLINPYGLDYPLYIWRSSMSSDPYLKAIMAYLSLWKTLSFKLLMSRMGASAWSMVIMGSSFLLLSLYHYYKTRYVNLALLALNAFLFFYSMSVARVSMFFNILIVFSIFYMISKLDKPVAFKSRFAPLALLLFVIVSLHIGFATVRYVGNGSWFGSGLDQYVPVKEVEFIKKYRIPAPLFNDYLIGGYMMWTMYPEYKVFIDPRYGPYSKQVGPDYLNFIKNPTPEAVRALTAKYPFKVALIHLRSVPLIFSFLTYNRDEWRMLYFERNAVILIHKSYLPYLSREALDVSMNPSRFQDLSNPEVLFTLFNFYFKLGPQYAHAIYEIYERNVNKYYFQREMHLNIMAIMLVKKIDRLKQQKAGAANPGVPPPPPAGDMKKGTNW